MLKLSALGTALHKDALYSSISAAIHLCPRVDPDYQHLSFVCLHITQLMESDDKKVGETLQRGSNPHIDRGHCRYNKYCKQLDTRWGMLSVTSYPIKSIVCT